MNAHRVNIAEAARLLDLTEAAVRSRVARGQLESERDRHGRVWVTLRDDEVDESPDKSSDEIDETFTKQSTQLVEALEQRIQDLQERLEDQRERIEDLRERIQALEQLLQQEQAANAELRGIIANLLDRVPAQLLPSQEAPPEPRESPVAATEEPTSGIRDTRSRRRAQKARSAEAGGEGCSRGSIRYHRNSTSGTKRH
jgi:TolA-binding protein